MKKLQFLLILSVLFACSANGPQFLTEDTVLEGVKIQPRQALTIAEEHLSKHGTVIWKDENRLQTHIVKKGKYYYVKKSDFPAKASNWYLHSCIQIDSQTGEVNYIE